MPGPSNIHAQAAPRVSSDDPVLTHFQDALLSILNPFMRAVAAAIGVIPQYSSVSRPTAGGNVAGWIIRVKDSGQPEQVQVCVSKSDGRYEWVVVGIASF